VLGVLRPAPDAEAQIAGIGARSIAYAPSDPAARLTFPVDLEGIVSFLGYEREPTQPTPGGEVRWITYWRVVSAMPRQLKLFLHVCDQDGQVVAQQDVFAVPRGTWQPGDLIAHAFAVRLPPDIAPGRYAVLLGWYEEEGWRRLAVRRDGQVVGDHVLLAPVEVGGED